MVTETPNGASNEPESSQAQERRLAAEERMLAERERARIRRLESRLGFQSSRNRTILQALLPIAGLIFVAYALTTWWGHLDRQAEITARGRSDAAFAGSQSGWPGSRSTGDYLPTVTGKNRSDTLGINVVYGAIQEEAVRQASAPPGSRRISSVNLNNLIDALVKAGSLTFKTADQLKDAIASALIGGTKEITVDAAKAIIDRYLAPPRPNAPTGPPTQTHVLVCCCSGRGPAHEPPKPPQDVDSPSCEEP
jgi:hypothetical protein